MSFEQLLLLTLSPKTGWMGQKEITNWKWPATRCMISKWFWITLLWPKLGEWKSRFLKITYNTFLHDFHVFWATLKNNHKIRCGSILWILVFQDRVGGRTYGRELKAAKGTDMWDLGGQWIGRWEDDFVEEKQSLLYTSHKKVIL